MKVFALSFLVLLGACGEAPAPSSNLGGTRSLSSVTMDDQTFERLSALCLALESKAQNLSLGSFQQFTFRVEDIRCSGAVAVTQVPVKVSSSGFQSTSVPNVPFVFPNIETNTSGVMGTVCANLTARTNPIRTSSTTALWVSTNSTLDCVPRANETCVLIESGSVPDGASDFRITGQEWMRFSLSTNDQRFGFFTERRSIAQGACEDGKVNDLRAILID